MKFDLNGKTYLELSHDEPMTVGEIERLYNGYWVYIVNAEFCAGRHNLLRGIPVVIGTMAYAGSEDGIYKKYRNPQYGEHKEYILLDDGFISALTVAEGKDTHQENEGQNSPKKLLFFIFENTSVGC